MKQLNKTKKQMPIYIGKIYLTNVELSEEIAESLIVFKPSAIEIHWAVNTTLNYLQLKQNAMCHTSATDRSSTLRTFEKSKAKMCLKH